MNSGVQLPFLEKCDQASSAIDRSLSTIGEPRSWLSLSNTSSLPLADELRLLSLNFALKLHVEIA